MDDERIFLFLDNQIEVFRINSGALIWKDKIGNKNTHIVSMDVMNDKYISFIKKSLPKRERF